MGPVAQKVEHRTFNPGVVGSIPTRLIFIMKLSGKVALIGGSTKGIGRAIAKRFSHEGARVVINGRDEASAEEVLRELKGEGVFIKADLTKYEDVKRMVDEAVGRFGRLDIVVANGASDYPPAKFFHEIEPSLYPDYILTRLFTRLYMIRSSLDYLKGGGKIIIITTDAGRTPTPGESMIGACGSALVMLTKVLAREFSRWKIYVNTICLTVTANTPGFERALKYDSTGKIFKRASERTPFWPIYPEDVAELALFLASSSSDKITGQIFSINGGLSFPG